MPFVLLKTKLILPVLALTALILLASQRSADQSLPDDRVALGKLLFFEKALSLDSTISCASCHLPDFAFADTSAFSFGVGGRLGLRNTPSIMNVNARDLMFYDGRAASIEDQVHFPVEDPNEMNVGFDEVVRRLNADPFYTNSFMKLYGSKPDRANLAAAVAAFERSLETANTPFDDYMSDKAESLNASAIRGRDIFLSDRARCFDCHFGPDFTGDEFKNIGLYDGKLWNDAGRFNITKDSSDLGKFKVPGLRNVGVTGPYMHNGRFRTLEEVIDFYSDPYRVVAKPINIDSTLQKPLNLSAEEKADLLSFLLSLTDRRFLNR